MKPTGSQGPSESRRYFLTIAEVMAIFRVGRTTAYALARQYIATGGDNGIPCEKLGGQLRFPTAEIERLIGRPVVFPISEANTRDAAASEPQPGAKSDEPTRRRSRRCRTRP